METPKREGHTKKQDSAKRNLILSPNLTQVEVSPGRSPSQGNLTGSARKIKDGVADWHNYIQKWDNCNSRGLAIIKQIINLKLKTSSVEALEREERSLMSKELEDLCDQLTSVLSIMSKILEKFSALTLMMNNVGELEFHQNKGEWEDDPLFQTWPTWKFYETSKELLNMYEKEFAVKKIIVENVAHSSDRDLSMVYTATWLHQPYIPAKKENLLIAMLMECRLK